jgi:hypothetical protein
MCVITIGRYEHGNVRSGPKIGTEFNSVAIFSRRTLLFELIN